MSGCRSSPLNIISFYSTSFFTLLQCFFHVLKVYSELGIEKTQENIVNFELNDVNSIKYLLGTTVIEMVVFMVLLSRILVDHASPHVPQICQESREFARKR